MKIAFVYDAVYPWVKGGAEKRIYELGKRLAQRGDEVHVFGVKWWEGPDVITYDGMVLHGVCGPLELYVNGRRSISEAIIFSIRLLPHLIIESFDVIDACAFPYFPCFCVKIAALTRRTRVMITWHEVWGDYWYEYLGKKGLFGKIVESMVSKLSERPIAVSETTKTALESLGVDGKNITIVHNGIDLKEIGGIPPSSHACDMIFVGRLIREKNADVLIKAVGHIKKALPDVKCSIIGDGPEKERLAGLAARQGDNVRFLGFMEHEEVIARIKSAKVLVLPSSREGFGMVVIEAFACGVPVVTVNAPRNSASELVDTGTGRVVNPDARDIGDAVLEILTDKLLRERMSGAALKKAQEYEWDKIVDKMSHLYEDK